MKITKIETYPVSVGWKNWLLIKVFTDDDLYGISEATINGFIATTEKAVEELAHLVIGKDPRQVNLLADQIISTFADVGHIHRMVMGAIEVACWDILGKSLGVPIWNDLVVNTATLFRAMPMDGIGPSALPSISSRR